MSYAYDCEMWCDQCAEEIISDLDKKGIEDSRDTNEYPQWCQPTEEADCPHHCGGCGEFLENNLTTDGADYVLAAVADDLAEGRESIAVTVWQPYYNWLNFPTQGDDDE